jgi:hypothetical protein
MSWHGLSTGLKRFGGRKSTLDADKADARWSVYPLTDAVWAMFYYTQLYICAFSFVSLHLNPLMAASTRGTSGFTCRI